MTQSTLFHTTIAAATISDCTRYRYTLTRVWDDRLPMLVWVMLNPSAADASRNDPTIKRCITRAKRMGYGGIVVLNLFAWRATNPKDLPPTAAEAIGPLNDAAIAEQAAGRTVVCAWGVHGERHGRGRQVRDVLSSLAATLMCLRRTKDGHPEHPLYVPASVTLAPY